MDKQIFKVGDRVFDINYGWGVVRDVYKDGEIRVDFKEYEKDIIRIYNADGRIYTGVKQPVLSFTEYTLKGFSQKRPVDYKNHIGKWGKFWNKILKS